ncbi:MAG: DUF6174 domain-containing protein [Chloroflexota bacterium]|nr:DUF6174 domain-containing protein [Chloroflexota bacterium]
MRQTRPTQKPKKSYRRRLLISASILVVTVALILLLTGGWRRVWEALVVPSYTVNVSAEDVDNAQAIWRERAVRNYQITILQGQPQLRGAVYELTIHGEQVVKGRRALLLPPWTLEQAKSLPAEEWEEVEEESHLAELEIYTVTALFEVARQTIERGAKDGRCDTESTITFDPDWGLPVQIEYAWDTNCARNSPEWWAVLDFVPLR